MRSKQMLKSAETPFLDWQVAGTELRRRPAADRPNRTPSVTRRMLPEALERRATIHPLRLVGHWLTHGAIAGAVTGVVASLGLMLWAVIDGDSLVDEIGQVVVVPLIGSLVGGFVGSLMATLLVIVLVGAHHLATALTDVPTTRFHIRVARVSVVALHLVLWRLWGPAALVFLPATIYVMFRAHRVVPKYAIEGSGGDTSSRA